MSNIKVFEDKKIRTQWNEQEEDWYFSVVDVIAVLTDSSQPRKYWNDLKRKLKQEGSQLSEKIGQLKLQSSDGKYYNTDVVNTKDLLRLIQSIPSKKAEPFKVWLAQVGSERLDEIVDPQKAIDRAIATYRDKGYSEEWITQRMMTIKMRKELTAEWQDKGITQEKDYAILTNEMTKAWSGMSVQEYKKFKGIRKESLRDNMSDLELLLTDIGEVTTRELAKEHKPFGLEANKVVAKQGGEIASNTKKDIEKKLGKKIINSNNNLSYKYLEEQEKIENK